MNRSNAPAASARIEAIAALVPDGARVADVGCDHARLALALAASGRAAFVLATEIDDDALGRALRPPPGATWGERIAYRAGRGLGPLEISDRLGVIVVAGLGGRSIVAILDDAKLAALAPRRLVLQPATEAGMVRRFLTDRGFKLVAERLVLSRGRLHPLLAAEPGDGGVDLRLSGLTADDVLEAGPLLLRSRDPGVLRHWEAQHERLLAIVARRGSGRVAYRAARELARARRVLAFLGSPDQA